MKGLDADWEVAVQAARSRKAEDVVVLNIQEVSSFTDQFVICTGTTQRQVQSIADAIEMALKEEGVRPIGIEGYNNGGWVLLDYGDFVAHVFSSEARVFYNLERLWKNAPRIPVPEAA
jgi:ribosome-associated protein